MTLLLDPQQTVPLSPAELADFPALDLDHTVFGQLSYKQMYSIAHCLDTKIAIWVGAVSAGKTFSSLIGFLEAVRRTPIGETIVIVGKTLQSIERNVISQLQKPSLFGDLAAQTVYTSGASQAKVLGRRVELVGAYNIGAAERIRGGTFHLTYVDEATLLPHTEEESFWNMLVTRHRTKGAHILATTNPASRNHWLHRDWILKNPDGMVTTFHLTMADNPGLPPEYVAQMEASFSGLFYDRFILGLWTSAAGAVYQEWDEDVHVIDWSDMPDIDEVICVGIDYGTSNPSSAIMLGITREFDHRLRETPRLVLMDEWRYDSRRNPDGTDRLNQRRMTPDEQADAVKFWLRQEHTPWGGRVSPRFLFVDPAAADFRETLLRKKLPNAPADNAVTEGIADVSMLLGHPGGNRLLMVARPNEPATPGCQGFLDEVTEYVWDEKQTKLGNDVPVKVGDHSMDAARYAIRSSRQIWLPRLRRAYRLAA